MYTLLLVDYTIMSCIHPGSCEHTTATYFCYIASLYIPHDNCLLVHILSLCVVFDRARYIQLVQELINQLVYLKMLFMYI